MKKKDWVLGGEGGVDGSWAGILKEFFLGVFGVWLRLFDVERVCKMNEVVKGLDDC